MSVFNIKWLHRHFTSAAKIVLAVAIVASMSVSRVEGATYRPVVRGLNGAVSAGHPLVADVALQVLKDGGNAIDAGVAATLATCVLEHTHHSFGGESPILVYTAKTGTAVAINGVGPAPVAATAEFFLDTVGGIPDEDSILNAPVPGTFDALILALDKYGTMNLARVMAPAIHYAEVGHPVDAYIAGWIDNAKDIVGRWPTSSSVFLPGGQPPKAGDIWKQPDLARMMRTLVEVEAANAHNGRSAALKAVRDEFYKGSIAQTVAKFMEENGGLITMEDMAAYEARIEEPWTTEYKGYTLITNGTYTQAPAFLQAMNILEPFDLKALGHNSPAYIHLVSQAIMLAMADRHAYYGDPDFVEVPKEGLLSKQYAAERRKLIDPARAVPFFPPGDAWKYQPGGRAHLAGTHVANLTSSAPTDYEDPRVVDATDTIYLCVIDRDGNMFSTTSSNNMGPRRSGVVPGNLGFVLSGRLRQFSLDPDNANYILPGKRPRITPCPALVLKDGQPWMTLGSPGEDVQVQVLVQTFLNVVEFGMDPQEAVEAARFRTFAFPASQHPQAIFQRRVNVEARIPESVVQELTALGWDARTEPDWQGVNGGAAMIIRDPNTGALAAGADPRRACYAASW
ncbi:MAG: gamma-glutamyltransferase family protein [Firmicutes bacterium]|jgi:gamma-glutamyltranspeptidase/glutathione hydrolase|nr:gamma-glutamyltransferase family protein [Bacillota bacterium]